MKYFTPEDFQPSEASLLIIRQVAYTYRTMKRGQTMSLCLN